jgi:hypothetical protein
MSKNTANIIRFVWNLLMFGFFSYLVFWKGQSGWWYLFMLVLWMKREEQENHKLKVVKFKKTPSNFRGTYPFAEGEDLLMLGEIEGMDGHIALADKAGKVYWAYRAKNFVERES